MELARNYTVHPSIVPFHNSHAQVKALCGPVGNGKSTACCFEVHFSMQEAREPLRWIVVRESYRQLHDSTRRTWEYWFGHCSRYVKVDEKMLVTVQNVDGKTLTHEIDFRHARRPEEASNLLSTEYAGAWLEEPVPAYQMSEGVIGAGLSKELFDMMLMRVRQAGAHRPHILLSFNPPHRFHWIYREFFHRLDKVKLDELDYALFRSPPFENKGNLPAGYYERLLQRLDPELARRFVLGEPVTLYPGVRVFPEARESVHFRDYLEVLPGVELVIGFDFGLTPVALIGQTLPNGRLQLYREVQMFNAGIKRLAEALQEVLKEPDPITGGPRFRANSWRCWGDPAGAQRAQTDEKTCFEILAQHGFTVRPGAIDFESRRQGVKQRLESMIDGEPALVVDQQGCPTLAEGMLGGYRFPQSGDGRVLAMRPIKNQFSHVNDALQMMVTGEYATTTGMKLGVEEPKKPKPWNPLADNQPGTTGSSWMAN